MNLIDKMKEKILDIINPDIEYTQEDFNKEFSKVNTTTDSYKLSVNFVNNSNNPNPEYATAGSSGVDLRAFIPEPIIIPAGERAIIPTGLFFEIPPNFEMSIRPRSGLAFNNGVVAFWGTIDSDYRGEVKILLFNFSSISVLINSGDRIAQAVLSTVASKNIINLNQVTSITTETERGSGGLGSTGLK